ncbi:UDP-N-acetylmuramoyl-L-alanyl-D-glutamate--2,6-diaminopimelate ligase [Jiangella asiatica]|uniref:UDP-N-acetylmuramoyl-L-alanyl-D-glutamate--2,6-diaminopimelate ligase n=1 Tax=Jiangella asiatica TaxID=2530372 RepID=A0A4R5CHF0_9ACTN|nr:UDP-N-acetylmuramoyl-L-alanyl-D-glutamate--2,6-diaminopimelate ligase [Jiangella asiatica]TDD97733.1 UDP-N-acetylmuramoyl-L-alanyl-D-glutamate--2,6-diaminopimelate ligase [Jiangella asiatica]
MPDRPGLRPRHVAPLPLAALATETSLSVDPGVRDVSVTGVTHDSRQIRPGDLYLALPGAVTHGARFAADAVRSGAVAVVTDPAGLELAGDLPAPVLTLDHPRSRLGAIAAAVYGHPARDLLMLGVTGTNGKTTTSYLLESGLRAAGHTTGLIGTVETRVGDEKVASIRTTPEATDAHALLAVMRERGVTACAMEVSSHAMVFGRVDGIVFDVAGFTNLSQDHLDFHTGLEDYFAAKARLFTPERTRSAVVVVGDEFGRRLAATSQVPTVTVLPVDHGTPAEVPADWRVEHLGDAAVLAGPDGEKLELHVPLPGEFNVTNAALAVTMLLRSGIDAADAVRGVAECPGVPGRMERVTVAGAGARPSAVVDFAHSPAAIDNVLRALHPAGRLIAVVGAGGDRDREKRPLMGRAAAAGADLVVVTDDNPRSEDPTAIRAAVVDGARAVPAGERAEILEVAGRREAIRAALRAATGAEDTVVVLGKGHEQGQEIAGVVQPFDDREVLREELRRWSGGSGSGSPGDPGQGERR